MNSNVTSSEILSVAAAEPHKSAMPQMTLGFRSGLAKVEHASTATVRPVGGRAKRLVDVCFSFAALLAVFPLILLIIATIKLTSRGSVFFSHPRIGFNGETFSCLKFRSMFADAAERLETILATDPVAKAEWDANQKLARDPRITAVGSFLRRSSLDELPQLLNVLLGQMSLVGPRPIVRAEAPRYGASYAEYIKARPGITGLWQVSGRSNTGYDQRVALDAAYISSWKLTLDFKILAQTVVVVLTRKGAV